ncbi:MAG: IS1634 family transposase, partial [Thermoplasmata archaeon]
KTIGAEYVGYSMLKELGLDSFLLSLGFSKSHIDLSILSIISRLVYPSSEHATKYWAKNITALDKLLSTSFNHISHNSLYRISDKLFSYKEQIENYLAKKQEDLFSLKNTLILYDLTNTYFEGSGKAQKLSYGYSKEKRYDCPLISLGLVIDHLGFVKHTHVFEGNVSESKTLKSILETISNYLTDRPTIALDAGIATKDNLELIRQYGFDYICVARNKNSFSDLDFEEEKLLDENTTLSFSKTDKESILYVQSKKQKAKEESMKSKAQQAFEKKLNSIIESQEKRKKKYDKALEQISRLKEKYSLVSRFYTINIKQENNTVKSIEYFINQEKLNERFLGSYYIRTSRTDLDEKQIKDLYSMLTRVEESFRSLKSELGLRPNFHQRQERIEAHIFITTLAYHILNAIIYRLRIKGMHYSFKTVRTILSTHTLNTISLKTKDDKQIYISSCTQAQENQKQIYEALNLKPVPIEKKSITK